MKTIFLAIAAVAVVGLAGICMLEGAQVPMGGAAGGEQYTVSGKPYDQMSPYEQGMVKTMAGDYAEAEKLFAKADFPQAHEYLADASKKN